MIKTRLCAFLDIKYPIIQAPMAWITWAELAAAVSNAGGLGTIGPNAGVRAQAEAENLEVAGERLREEIRRAKSLTERPFAVNFVIGRGKQIPFCDRFVEIGIEEGVQIALVTMGSPEVYTERLRKAGMKVLHAVGSVKHARKVEEAGVDVVVCEGFEGGGHLGGEELTTMVMVPQIASAVKIPVVAGGGIADARGLVAALALGAEGVYMGTRFLATHECRAHPRMKQAVLEAEDTSTVAFGRKVALSRCLKNEYTRRYMELEAGGASFEEIRAFERSGTPELKGQRRYPAAVVEGNLVHGSVGMGAIAGMIKETLSAAEVVRGLVEGAAAVLSRLEEILPAGSLD